MSLEADLVDTVASVFSGRFHPIVAPAGTVSPYAVYQRISGTELSDMNGSTNLTNARYQITIFDREQKNVIAKAEAVKAAMNAATLFSSICQNELDDADDPRIYYARILDFSIWRYTS